MKYVVAVSGGVDSVVLLDMLVKSGEHELVVAHFDHGIRAESDWDARFVAALATNYGLECVMKREALGPQASEATARERRYAFLKSLAQERGARLVTAHHKDDVTESIVINLTRGTGWRGLAVLNDPAIDRPLIEYRKAQLYEYALANQLEWVEDETNQTDAYLRNRVRSRLSTLDDSTTSSLLTLWQQQRKLAEMIDSETSGLLTNSRYFMTMIDEDSALEILRAWIHGAGLSLTRPQRRRLRESIKTAKPGTDMQAGGGVTIGFTKREFIVKHP